jgi:photosystem II stability/assembly factor-like uncharacterized protein
MILSTPHAGRALLVALAVACSPRNAPDQTAPVGLAPALVAQQSGTTALLQAVSAVDDRVVWVSGHRGTWARTTDGGATWRTGSVPDGDSLQFRDVHALDADVAWLMSAGPGDASRIYHTTDGGRTWARQFVNADPGAFYDCIDFWDRTTGAAFSDASQGRTLILATADGGRSWSHVPAEAVPAPLPNEGGFAASGTCLVTLGARHGWIGTGNSTTARVLRTTDRGASWTASPTPIVTGEAAGITTVAFRDTLNGLVLGGVLSRMDDVTDNVAVTHDGGRTWTLAAPPTFAGPVFGSAWVPNASRPTLVAVGPKGAALTRDDGRTWAAIDTLSYWAVGFASARAGWAVGPNGRITRISLE